jgi:hypothetical protein
MTKESYFHATYDMILAPARTLARLKTPMIFLYVSGAGTDGTEKGRTMWAASKAKPKTPSFACLSKPPICSVQA